MNECASGANKQKTATKRKPKWKVTVLLLLLLIILTTASIFYITYRTHPLIRLKNAFQKTLHSGNCTFTVQKGEETNGGTASIDLKRKEYNMQLEFRERIYFVYENTAFFVDKNTETVSGFEDFSETIAFLCNLCNGKADVESFLMQLRSRQVFGSMIDYFFDAEKLPDALAEYIRKLIETEYLEDYFGYRKIVEKHDVVYSFSPALYDAVSDFAKTLRSAFWNDEKYMLFCENLIEKRKPELESRKIKIDFKIQSGYIIGVTIQNDGEVTTELAFSDFGKTKTDFKQAEAYYRKEKDQRGWE